LDVRRFRADLHKLAARACAEDNQEVRAEVFGVADILVNLYRKNLVKINHSALELVCARSLIRQGYEVKVEHKLDRGLVCDVMGTRGTGTSLWRLRPASSLRRRRSGRPPSPGAG